MWAAVELTQLYLMSGEALLSDKIRSAFIAIKLLLVFEQKYVLASNSIRPQHSHTPPPEGAWQPPNPLPPNNPGRGLHPTSDQ